MEGFTRWDSQEFDGITNESAGERYADKSCDSCGEPVGKTGSVNLEGSIVWAACCKRCLDEERYLDWYAPEESA